MRLRIVLVGIEGAVNLGFILRLAKNFRVDEIVIVNPKVKLDLERETILEYAAKAKDYINKIVLAKSLEEALEGCELSACTTAKSRREDVLRQSITPEELASIAASKESIAVVFGRESTGLTRKELSKCDLTVTIPANPEYPVLNLSHAVAIVLYELSKKRYGLEIKPAAREDMDFLIESFNLLANAVDHDRNRVEKACIAFKHLISKCMVTEEEARIISFVLRRAYRRAST